MTSFPTPPPNPLHVIYPGIDFITCLVTIPFTVVFELLQYRLMYDIFCKTYMFLITSTVPFSAYIMVGIAVDRYLCICHPLLQVFTVSRVKIVIFLLTIPAMTFGTLTALSFGTASYEPATYLINHTYARTNDSGTMGNESDGYASTSTPFHKDVFLTPSSKSLNLEPSKKETTFGDIFRTTSVSVLFTNTRNHSSSSSSKLSASGSSVLKAHVANSGGENIQHLVSENHKDVETKLEDESPQVLRIKTFLYHDTCTTNGRFSDQFLSTYRKVHALNFMIAFIIVVVLYILIYKSIITRRAEKEARRNKNFVYLPDRGAGLEDRHVTEETDFTQKAFGGKFSPGNKTHDSSRQDKLNDPTSNVTITTINPEPTVLLEQEGTAKEENFVKESADSREADADNNQLKNGSQTLNENRFDKPDEEPQLLAEEKPLIPVLPNDPLSDKNCPQAQKSKGSNSNSPATPDARGRSSRRFQSHNPRASKVKHKRNAAAVKTDATGYKRVSTSGSGKHKDANSVKRKRPCNKHQMYMANIKTALMLLVVTTVFMVAFLPSLLMANKILPINLTVFYGYFIYHVANPFIYAFMNQNFRDDLKKILATACRRK
ncbi:orexin receptor type 2-like [Elysia marginata]|uniref:Orexin receptor type 2-like n=1 Tax=Elysia marginata TaxID=1093978 RepID=A0AAV4JT40_9GAST|nr:orexin receptor type 2-like [Elysia marginata]